MPFAPPDPLLFRSARPNLHSSHAHGGSFQRWSEQGLVRDQPREPRAGVLGVSDACAMAERVGRLPPELERELQLLTDGPKLLENPCRSPLTLLRRVHCASDPEQVTNGFDGKFPHPTGVRRPRARVNRPTRSLDILCP